ncbi:MAG: DUF2975 domain-containing protein [Clostridiales bacterium]|nr:DUF2975 domain-containing protein [Clostridiales bacterium]
MWNQRRSVVLSIVCTWVAVAAVICFAIFLPSAPKWFPYPESILTNAALLTRALPAFYGCCAAVMVSLVFLLALLHDIRREKVFTTSNVMRLRVIAWCSFAVFAILILTAFFEVVTPALLTIALAAGFFFLLLRVIKNVIEAARLLKEEQDLTI